jgi:hypothetical protein
MFASESMSQLGDYINRSAGLSSAHSGDLCRALHRHTRRLFRLLIIRFSIENVRDVSIPRRFDEVPRPDSPRSVVRHTFAKILDGRFVARLATPVHWHSLRTLHTSRARSHTSATW